MLAAHGTFNLNFLKLFPFYANNKMLVTEQFSLRFSCKTSYYDTQQQNNKLETETKNIISLRYPALQCRQCGVIQYIS